MIRERGDSEIRVYGVPAFRPVWVLGVFVVFILATGLKPFSLDTIAAWIDGESQDGRARGLALLIPPLVAILGTTTAIQVLRGLGRIPALRLRTHGGMLRVTRPPSWFGAGTWTFSRDEPLSVSRGFGHEPAPDTPRDGMEIDVITFESESARAPVALDGGYPPGAAGEIRAWLEARGFTPG